MAMPGKAQPDLNEIEKGFIELLDKIRAGARLATKAPDAQEGLPANGQGDLFLVIDHEGVTVGVARDEKEFNAIRFMRIVEVLAREVPSTMQPELQLAMAGRRMSEIMPRFQMIRP
jgi:hypothetical protein